MPYRFTLSSGISITCDTAQEAHELLVLDNESPMKRRRERKLVSFPLVGLLKDLRDSPNEGIHVDQVSRSLGVSSPNAIGSKIRGDKAILNAAEIDFDRVREAKRVKGESYWFSGPGYIHRHINVGRRISYLMSMDGRGSVTSTI